MLLYFFPMLILNSSFFHSIQNIDGTSGHPAYRQPQDFCKLAENIAKRYNIDINWGEELAPLFTALYELPENQKKLLLQSYESNAYQKVWKRIQDQLRIKPRNDDLNSWISAKLEVINSDQLEINSLCLYIWKEFERSYISRPFSDEKELPSLSIMLKRYSELHKSFELEVLVIIRFIGHIEKSFEDLYSTLGSLEKFTDSYIRDSQRGLPKEAINKILAERQARLTTLNTQIEDLEKSQFELKHHLGVAKKTLDYFYEQRELWIKSLNRYTDMLKDGRLNEREISEIFRQNVKVLSSKSNRQSESVATTKVIRGVEKSRNSRGR